jgi:hypothetical protein
MAEGGSMGDFVQTPLFASILAVVVVLAIIVGLFLNPAFRKKLRSWWREPKSDPFEREDIAEETWKRQPPEARLHGTAGPRPVHAHMEKKAAPGHRSG